MEEKSFMTVEEVAAVMPYNFVAYGVWVWYNQISKSEFFIKKKYRHLD